MQPHKTVEAYLDSVVPEKLSDSVKAELREELECHIYDKAEFYMEIGYDEEVAFVKAVEEMGEAEPVRKEFAAIHQDSSLKGILLFFGLCTVNILSVKFGLGYWYFVESSMHEMPSLFWLVVFLIGFVLLTTHTIRCCREKLHKQLEGIVSALGLISLGSVVTSGLIYPILNAAHLVLCYITNAPEPKADLAFPVNIVVLVISTIACFMSLNKDYRFRQKSYRLSLKAITIILSVISFCFAIIYIPAYEKYIYPYSDKSWYEEETHESEYLSIITKEQLKIYNSIKLGDGEEETEKMLKEKGYVNENTVRESSEIIEEIEGLFPFDEDEQEYISSGIFNYEMEQYMSQKLSQNVGEREYSSYYYTTKGEDEDSYFDDIVSCILVAYNDEGKIDYKLYFPDVESGIGSVYYWSYTHGKDTLKWYESLKKGDSIESSLEFIRNTGALIIEDEKTDSENTVNTYRIDLQCFYPLETDFINFIFGIVPENVFYSYTIDIEAQNGKITSGTMGWYDYDNGSITKKIS